MNPKQMKLTTKNASETTSFLKLKSVTERNRLQREKILKLAGNLFWQQGYLGTSIDDIAQAVDLNKATIYYYFKDKNQILYEIVSNANQQLYKLILPIYSSDLTTERKLELMVTTHIEWAIKNQGLAGIGQVERKNLSPNRLKAFTQMRDDYEALFRDIIRKILAKQQSTIIDSKLATLLILSMLNSIRQWYKPSGKLTGNKIAKQTAVFVFRALSCFY